MRIIGGRDYYDHGLAYGVDDQITFVRTGTKIFDFQFPVHHYGAHPNIVVDHSDRPKPRWIDFERRLIWSHHGTTYEVDPVAVIFCGKLYSGVRIWYHTAENDPYKRKDWEKQTFWDQNSLGKWLSGRAAHLQPPERRKLTMFSRESRHEPTFQHRDLTPEEKSRIIDLRITVATLTSLNQERTKRPGDNYESDQIYWDVNCDTLKDMDFIKVLDPVTAFQEISMWVGGVLPNQGRPMVEITDQKVKIEKHGFDYKTSFRKGKEKA